MSASAMDVTAPSTRATASPGILRSSLGLVELGSGTVRSTWQERHERTQDAATTDQLPLAAPASSHTGHAADAGTQPAGLGQQRHTVSPSARPYAARRRPELGLFPVSNRCRVEPAWVHWSSPRIHQPAALSQPHKAVPPARVLPHLQRAVSAAHQDVPRGHLARRSYPQRHVALGGPGVLEEHAVQGNLRQRTVARGGACGRTEVQVRLSYAALTCVASPVTATRLCDARAPVSRTCRGAGTRPGVPVTSRCRYAAARQPGVLA